MAGTKPAFVIVMGAGTLVDPTGTRPRSAGLGDALIVGASTGPYRTDTSEMACWFGRSCTPEVKPM